MLTDVNRLCHNVNAICVEHDQVIEKLNELKITLGNFKRLTSYYVEEKNIVRDNVIPPKERTVEIVPSFARAIPKICVKDSRTTNFGQQLVNEAFQIIVIPSQGNNPAAPLTPIAQLCHLLPVSMARNKETF